MTVEGPCAPSVLFSAALQGSVVHLHDAEAARTRPLAVDRWNDTDTTDAFVLAQCEGPTLDVGCGPGRMTAGLAATGLVALGIDVVPEAVRQTRARGVHALVRDVFDPVPGQGRWRSVLLADGNIGIGGDPVRLLRRVAELLMAGGRAVVDLHPPGRRSGSRTHRLSGDGMVSEPYPWAVLSADHAGAAGDLAGLRLLRTEEYDGRWFAVLEKP